MPEIVLVEDNGNDVAVALRAFRRRGLGERVVVLRDGDEALAFLRGLQAAQVPKVIFLDIKMPRRDGWELLREIRDDARLRHVPVVMVSWSDHEDDVRAAYRLGANSYMVKRLDPRHPGEYLVAAARYWVDLNRSER
jgi:two-component system response regulator